MLLYWIWYAMLSGLNSWQKCRLLEKFPDPEDIFHAEAKAFSEFSWMTSENLEALQKHDLSQAQKILGACTDKNIRLLTFRDSAYPERLRCIAQPPMVLYYRGVLPDFDACPPIGVVGTRKASSYGLQAARRLSGQIAACGGLVISGGAAGIDTMALLGALDAGTGAVAVLGSGVDVVYPASNRQLFQKLVQVGCLISEYPPGTPAYRWNFPERNRIISGLASGILVVEAPERSGALITARNAVEEGRDLYVVPGNIDVTSCAGSNQLLREGAMAVFSGYDILREYESLYPGRIHRRDLIPTARYTENSPEKVAQARALPEKIPPLRENVHKKDIDNRIKSPYSVLDGQLSHQEQAVLALLDTQPQSVDDVISASDLPPGKVLSVLTMLQIKGLVQSEPGKLVSLKNR